MSSKEDEMDLEKFFLPIEWSEMSALEKTRAENILDNYRTMKSFGFQPQEPFFIKDYRKRKAEDNARQTKFVPPLAKKVYRVNEGASTSGASAILNLKPSAAANSNCSATNPKSCIPNSKSMAANSKSVAANSKLLMPNSKSVAANSKPVAATTVSGVASVVDRGSGLKARPVISVEPPSEGLSVRLDIEKYFSEEEWRRKSEAERDALRAQLETYSLHRTFGKEAEPPSFVIAYKQRKIKQILETRDKMLVEKSSKNKKSLKPTSDTESSDQQLNSDTNSKSQNSSNVPETSENQSAKSKSSRIQSDPNDYEIDKNSAAYKIFELLKEYKNKPNKGPSVEKKLNIQTKSKTLKTVDVETARKISEILRESRSKKANDKQGSKKKLRSRSKSKSKNCGGGGSGADSMDKSEKLNSKSISKKSEGVIQGRPTAEQAKTKLDQTNILKNKPNSETSTNSEAPSVPGNVSVSKKSNNKPKKSSSKPEVEQNSSNPGTSQNKVETPENRVEPSRNELETSRNKPEAVLNNLKPGASVNEPKVTCDEPKILINSLNSKVAADNVQEKSNEPGISVDCSNPEVCSAENEPEKSNEPDISTNTGNSNLKSSENKQDIVMINLDSEVSHENEADIVMDGSNPEVSLENETNIEMNYLNAGVSFENETEKSKNGTDNIEMNYSNPKIFHEKEHDIVMNDSNPVVSLENELDIVMNDSNPELSTEHEPQKSENEPQIVMIPETSMNDTLESGKVADIVVMNNSNPEISLENEADIVMIGSNSEASPVNVAHIVMNDSNTEESPENEASIVMNDSNPEVSDENGADIVMNDSNTEESPENEADIVMIGSNSEASPVNVAHIVMNDSNSEESPENVAHNVMNDSNTEESPENVAHIVMNDSNTEESPENEASIVMNDSNPEVSHENGADIVMNDSNPEVSHENRADIVMNDSNSEVSLENEVDIVINDSNSEVSPENEANIVMNGSNTKESPENEPNVVMNGSNPEVSPQSGPEIITMNLLDSETSSNETAETRNVVVNYSNTGTSPENVESSDGSLVFKIPAPPKKIPCKPATSGEKSFNGQVRLVNKDRLQAAHGMVATNGRQRRRMMKEQRARMMREREKKQKKEMERKARRAYVYDDFFKEAKSMTIEETYELVFTNAETNVTFTMYQIVKSSVRLCGEEGDEETNKEETDKKKNKDEKELNKNKMKKKSTVTTGGQNQSTGAGPSKSCDKIVLRSTAQADQSSDQATNAGTVMQRSRYPRRNVPVKNYTEPENINMDDFVFCDECGREWYKQCNVHGKMISIPDLPVNRKKAGDNYARETTPRILGVAQSKIFNAGKGVWTRDMIKTQVQFGPYQGRKGKGNPKDPNYAWQLREMAGGLTYVDASDERYSNWMRYVNCARNINEMNLMAYQFEGGIYYRTFRLVAPHEELFVFYGEQFGGSLGIDVKNFRNPCPSNEKDVSFYCAECNSVFTSPLYLEEHEMKCLLGLRPGQRKKLLALKDAAQSTETSIKNDAILNVAMRTENAALQTENPLCNVADCSDEGNLLRIVANCCDEDAVSNNVQPLVESEGGKKVKDGFRCNTCNRLYSTKHSLNLHIRRMHLNDRPFPCSECTSCFVNKIELDKHYNVVHLKVKLFKCKMCNYKCSINSNLKTHMANVHLKLKQFECEICGEKFTQSGSLKRHKKLVHLKLREFEGKECGEKFSLNSNLKLREFEGKECGEKFSQNSNLKLREFECKECGEKFSRNSNLKVHTKSVHLKLREFECEICGEKFSLNGNLKKHTKSVHLKLKEFECEICGKRFAQNGDLKSHLRIHSGEKPYECNQCSYRCSNRTSLKYHIRRYHQQ